MKRHFLPLPSRYNVTDINLRRSEDHCPNFEDGKTLTNALPMGVLTVFPTSGIMWLTDIIERFTGRIITGSFMNAGDQSMYSQIK